MIKKNITLLPSAIILLLYIGFVSPLHATELDEATRTVTLDTSSKTITLTPEVYLIILALNVIMEELQKQILILDWS